jgi:hypothetical protein
MGGTMAGRPVWNQPLDCPISVIEIIGQFAEKYNSTSKFAQIQIWAAGFSKFLGGGSATSFGMRARYN